MTNAQPIRRSILEHTLRGLDRIARMRGRCAGLPAHLALGLAGEEAAYHHLRRKGYCIVARRWSSGDVRGDIDMVAWHGTLLCIVEVKTRSAHDETPAQVAVDRDKRRILRRLTRRYLRQLNADPRPQVRFDVVSVFLEPGHAVQIVHYENHFGWSETREIS